MKKLLLAVFSIATTFSLYAQREVPQERMEQIYEEVKTPYKYGLAVAPTDRKSTRLNSSHSAKSRMPSSA